MKSVQNCIVLIFHGFSPTCVLSWSPTGKNNDHEDIIIVQYFLDYQNE